VQGEHLERAESRKVAYCEISVSFDFSYGYGRKIQTCSLNLVLKEPDGKMVFPFRIESGDSRTLDEN